MNKKTVGGLLVAIALAVLVGAWLWHTRQSTPAAAPPTAPSAPIAVAPPPAASAPASAAPVIAHPIESPASAPPTAKRGALPPVDQADRYVGDALIELLGRKSVLTFLNGEHFVQQFVATVDNLDRAHASARLWPVNPAPGRFTTIAAADKTVIAAENPKRYDALVGFLASIDAAQAAALYRHLYPLFQHAYEQLGYPNKYFNDRLVQVIDHLVATADVAEPVAVRLTEVKGPVESTRPWVRYEYADPALESRSAGQKILMRVGATHARTLKAKLAEFRRLIARAPR